MCLVIPAYSQSADDLAVQIKQQDSASRLTLIAQADTKVKKEDEEKPRSGALVIPQEFEQKAEKKEKKCMTVCSRWGETCVFDVNRGRKCRRTCKEFAEECF